MLALDQKVTLSCTDTGKDAAGTIVGSSATVSM